MWLFFPWLISTVQLIVFDMYLFSLTLSHATQAPEKVCWLIKFLHRDSKPVKVYMLLSTMPRCGKSLKLNREEKFADLTFFQ